MSEADTTTTDTTTQTSTDTQTSTTEQQQQQAAYYEAFTDADLKTHPGVQKYKTVEDLARGYVNAEKRLGADPNSLLKIPANPEDKDGYGAVYKALGAPDSPDGYKIDMAGASEADLAAAKEFTVAMHAAGPFPPAFVSAATKWFGETVAKQNEALLAEAQRMTAAGEAELKAEWGEAYDARKTEIGKLVNDLGGADLAKEFDGSTFGDNPKLAKFMGKVLDLLAEPGPRREAADTGGKLTPAQAGAKARELEAHPAFRDKNHPQHAEVVAQRSAALRSAEATA